MNTKRLSRHNILRTFLVAVLAVWLQPTLSQTLVRANRQVHFKDSVPAGNYSGIAHLYDNVYALADDKAPYDGYRKVEIVVDSINGEIKSVADRGYVASNVKNRDTEGIVYVKKSGTLMTIGEADSKIICYSDDCQNIVKELQLEKGTGNSSYESLCHDEESGVIYACTEAPLPADDDANHNKIRIQAFDLNFNKIGNWMYRTDKPAGKKDKAGVYAFGVSELMAYDSHTLLVLEREAYVPKKKIGAWTICKLYKVDLSQSGNVGRAEKAADVSIPTVRKQLLHRWKTKMNFTRQNFANYEGMCMSPRLSDGSATIILVADSQNQSHGILRDWFKTIVVR